MGEFSRSIIILIFAAMCFGITNGEISGKCTYSFDCPGQEFCEDNHCKCENIVYSKLLYPVCSRWLSHKSCLQDAYCWENSKCINNQCVCDEGYYKIGVSCHKVQLQRVMGSCKMTDEAVLLCDISKHSVCVNNICVCTRGYIPSSNGSCEPKESYMKKHRLSEYRVKPGEYCRDHGNCILGLECRELECSCPVACQYNQSKEFCDCGESESTNAPIYLGIFLGLLIILFWYYIIKRTIRKHKKMLSQFSSLPAADDGYVPRSYALSPVHSSIQTETTADGTASPASRTAGTPIPGNTGTSQTYSINPPTAPSYPVKPESDKPPSYLDVISSPLYNPDSTSQSLPFEPNVPYPNSSIPLSSNTQQSSSPLHSLSGRPHSRSSSPIPHHSPTATPYPVSPLATPHPGSPSAKPHPDSPNAPLYPGSPDATLRPVNPSAPAGAPSPSYPLHSSVPEAPPAYNPYFNEDSVPGKITLSYFFSLLPVSLQIPPPLFFHFILPSLTFSSILSTYCSC
nr:uncharacterized protein LOC113818572 isoform X1 [Penaeus vannamei]